MRKLITAAILAGSTLAAGQAMATEVMLTATSPVIDLSVTEYIDAVPDVASFSTGVQTIEGARHCRPGYPDDAALA